MTNTEAVARLTELGYYAKPNDDGGFRGGTSRDNSGGISFVQNGFMVQASSGRWAFTFARGQTTAIETRDTLDELFPLIVEYLRSRTNAAPR